MSRCFLKQACFAHARLTRLQQDGRALTRQMPFQQILLDHAANQGGGAIRRVMPIRIRAGITSRGGQGGA